MAAVVVRCTECRRKLAMVEDAGGGWFRHLSVAPSKGEITRHGVSWPVMGRSPVDVWVESLDDMGLLVECWDSYHADEPDGVRRVQVPGDVIRAAITAHRPVTA